MTHRTILRIIGTFFLLGAVIHGLILLGILRETTPLLITIYFHSMVVVAPLTGIGLWFRKEWARRLGLAIALTQFPAHATMIYLDTQRNYGSGVPVWQRLLDLFLLTGYAIYVSQPTVRTLFKPDPTSYK